MRASEVRKAERPERPERPDVVAVVEKEGQDWRTLAG